MGVMEEFIGRSAFAAHMGIRVTEFGDGGAKAEMTVRPEHLNSFGSLHGAALFALADETFAVACNTRGQVSMAIQITVSYFRAVREGLLTAWAREVSSNPKLGTYLIEVTDAEKKPVALFQGTAYRKKETVEDMIRHPSGH